MLKQCQHGSCSVWVGPQTPARNSSDTQVRAEKRAVELAADTGLGLIAICPNFVLGPPLSSRVDSLSVGFMKVLWRLHVYSCRPANSAHAHRMCLQACCALLMA